MLRIPTPTSLPGLLASRLALWAGGFLVVNCAGLVLGSILLLPALAELGHNVAQQLAAA